MKKIIIALTISVALVGCKSNPTKTEIASMTNSDLCYKALRTAPKIESTAGRVFMGVMTMGLTEVSERNLEEAQATYMDEVRRRGLGNCSSETLAEIECAKIYTDKESTDFKKCLLDVSLGISSRHDSKDAVEEARRARAAAAWSAYQQQQQNEAQQYNYYQSQPAQ